MHHQGVGRNSEEGAQKTASTKTQHNNRLHSVDSDRSKSEIQPSPPNHKPQELLSKSKKGPQSCTSALSALNVLKDKVIRIVLLSGGDQK